MVALLGLSFGLGGTMLIHRSFKSSLSSTIDSDLQNYESIQSTLLIAVDTNSVSSYIDMSNIINQFSAQGNSNRKNIILRNSDMEVVSIMNSSSTYKEMKPSDENICNSIIWREKDNYYLQLCSSMDINTENLDISQMDIVYDITSVYAARAQEQNTFRLLLIAIFVVGSITSMIAASLLTKPLENYHHLHNISPTEITLPVCTSTPVMRSRNWQMISTIWQIPSKIISQSFISLWKNRNNLWEALLTN